MCPGRGRFCCSRPLAKASPNKPPLSRRRVGLGGSEPGLSLLACQAPLPNLLTGRMMDPTLAMKAHALLAASLGRSEKRAPVDSERLQCGGRAGHASLPLEPWQCRHCELCPTPRRAPRIYPLDQCIGNGVLRSWQWKLNQPLNPGGSSSARPGWAVSPMVSAPVVGAMGTQLRLWIASSG